MTPTVAQSWGKDAFTGRAYPPGTHITRVTGQPGWTIAGGDTELFRAWRQHRITKQVVMVNRPGDACANCGRGQGTILAPDHDGHGGWVCETASPGFQACSRLPKEARTYGLG